MRPIHNSVEKAESAYQSIEPLKQSILSFQANPDYRSRCYQRLQIRSAIEVADGLDQLAQQFELEPMVRQASELGS
ncbi:hypothetical protein IQ250_21590 [Pseudanabaenaceae cyanobacterium LEGE 13415]|nr:hypothetical protein [Pseudanabaenaceae cyanobacterium LEGE 13415]